MSKAKSLVSRPLTNKEHINYRLVSCMFFLYCMLSHNFFTVRYQSAPELVQRLQNLKHKNSVLKKYANRMREKIEKAVEPELVTLDDEANSYLTGIADSPECSSHISTIPQRSFQHIFWMQQVEAAKKSKSSSMRWHPLMIRWCLYLRHK